MREHGWRAGRTNAGMSERPGACSPLARLRQSITVLLRHIFMQALRNLLGAGNLQAPALLLLPLSFQALALGTCRVRLAVGELLCIRRPEHDKLVGRARRLLNVSSCGARILARHSAANDVEVL